jgi:hypothetical protein
MAHSWFQHVLASNESKHGWMDEVYFILEDFGLDAIADKSRKPILGCYTGYFSMVNSGKNYLKEHTRIVLTKIECTA